MLQQLLASPSGPWPSHLQSTAFHGIGDSPTLAAAAVQSKRHDCDGHSDTFLCFTYPYRVVTQFITNEIWRATTTSYVDGETGNSNVEPLLPLSGHQSISATYKEFLNRSSHCDSAGSNSKAGCIIRSAFILESVPKTRKYSRQTIIC